MKKKRNTDNLCRLWFRSFSFFLVLRIFFIVCVARRLHLGLMVCSVCHLLADPIYNDVRTTLGSKTHKNWMFSTSQTKMKENELDVELFSASCIQKKTLFARRFICQKSRIECTLRHYLQNTKPGILLKMWWVQGVKAVWLPFFSYVCDSIQSRRLLSHYLDCIA